MKTVLAMFVFVSLPCCVALPTFAEDDCVTWQLETATVYDKKPVTVTKYVDETVIEKKHRTSWKPVWQTEKKERRTTVLKPVQTTREREERHTVMRPVTETKYRERKIEETSYEDVTEIREERRTVLKPVIETEMREQEYTVRQKITEERMETENVTQYKPVTSAQTQLVPSTAIATVGTVNQSFRPQLKWLRPGQYTDPATGLSTWRRPGLHWVTPPAVTGVQTAVVPTLVPQTVETTTLVPEVVQRSRPIEVTRYEDRIERRKVPVQVKKLVEEVQVRKVPVTTRRPKTVTRIEKIPYQETKYVEETVTRKVPVTETTYREVEQVEPYEEQSCKWVAFTEETDVPKTVRKKVEYTTYQQVPRTVTRKVGVDQFGRRIEVAPNPAPATPTESAWSAVTSSTQANQSANAKVASEPNSAPARLLETSERQLKSDSSVRQDGANQQRIDYSGRPIVRREASFYQPTEARSVLVPETRPDLSRTRTKLARVEPSDAFAYDPDNAAMTSKSLKGETTKPVTEKVETRETSGRSFDWDVPHATLPGS